MNEYSTLWRKLVLLALAGVILTATHGVTSAQEEEESGYGSEMESEGEGEATGTAAGSTSGGGGGAQMYLLPYTVVILCIGVAMLFVCRSARRREKPRGEEYEVSTLAEIGTGGPGVPVITVGMRVDQVNKLLGKPEICRRGDDIYRELAQSGKLSEEEAAKEYSVYKHPAGRYELVSLEKRIIEVKTQPKREEG